MTTTNPKEAWETAQNSAQPRGRGRIPSGPQKNTEIVAAYDLGIEHYMPPMTKEDWDLWKAAEPEEAALEAAYVEGVSDYEPPEFDEDGTPFLWRPSSAGGAVASMGSAMLRGN